MDQLREARFDDLYQQHWRAVFAYLVRRGCDRHDAADLVGDVFSVAWARLDDVPDGDRLLPWLLVTARNVLANHVRRSIRIDETVRRIAGLPTETADDPADLVTITDDDPVGQALASLSVTDRELLMLIAWDGLSPLEAARVLGLARGTVRVRLHRARRRLRTELARPEFEWCVPDPDGPRQGNGPATTVVVDLAARNEQAEEMRR